MGGSTQGCLGDSRQRWLMTVDWDGWDVLVTADRDGLMTVDWDGWDVLVTADRDGLMTVDWDGWDILVTADRDSLMEVHVDWDGWVIADSDGSVIRSRLGDSDRDGLMTEDWDGWDVCDSRQGWFGESRLGRIGRLQWIHTPCCYSKPHILSTMK